MKNRHFLRRGVSVLVVVFVIGLGTSAYAEAMWLVVLAVASGIAGLLADVGPGPTHTPDIKNYAFVVPDKGRVHVGDKRFPKLGFEADLGNVCPYWYCSGTGNVSAWVTNDGLLSFDRIWANLDRAEKEFEGDQTKFLLTGGGEPGTTIVESNVMVCGDDEGAAISNSPTGAMSFLFVDNYVCKGPQKRETDVTVKHPFTQHEPLPEVVTVGHGLRGVQDIRLYNASTACGGVSLSTYDGGGTMCFHETRRRICGDASPDAEFDFELAAGTEDKPSRTFVTPDGCDNDPPVWDLDPVGHDEERRLRGHYSLRMPGVFWTVEADSGVEKDRWYGATIEAAVINRCGGGHRSWTATPPTPRSERVGTRGEIRVRPRSAGRRAPGSVPAPRIRVRDATHDQRGTSILRPRVADGAYACGEAPGCDECCWAKHLTPTGRGDVNAAYLACVSTCGEGPARRDYVYEYEVESFGEAALLEIEVGGARYFAPTTEQVIAGYDVAVTAVPRTMQPIVGRVVDATGAPLSGGVYRRYRYSDVFVGAPAEGASELVAMFSAKTGGEFTIRGTMLDFDDEEALFVRLHRSSTFNRSFVGGPEAHFVIAPQPAERGTEEIPVGFPDIVFESQIQAHSVVALGGAFADHRGNPATGLVVRGLDPESDDLLSEATVDQAGAYRLQIPAGAMRLEVVDRRAAEERLVASTESIVVGLSGATLKADPRRLPRGAYDPYEVPVKSKGCGGGSSGFLMLMGLSFVVFPRTVSGRRVHRVRWAAHQRRVRGGRRA